MKKLALSAIVLCSFSISIALFQISCQKNAVAASVPPQNKIVYVVGTEPTWAFWIANTDGSNAKQIPISLPSGMTLLGPSSLDAPTASISADGKSLFFTVTPSPNPDLKFYIYSVSLDGTNLKQVLDMGSNLTNAKIIAAF